MRHPPRRAPFDRRCHGAVVDPAERRRYGAVDDPAERRRAESIASSFRIAAESDAVSGGPTAVSITDTSALLVSGTVAGSSCCPDTAALSTANASRMAAGARRAAAASGNNRLARAMRVFSIG